LFDPEREFEMICAGGAAGVLAEFAGELVDCHGGVVARVGVDAEDDHRCCSPVRVSG
jgi:hypothetical protein